jgi:ABC-type transport system involved in cytochrome bd biosynthesis fused ATPase/permease subunit
VSRLVEDVDALQGLYLRGIAPPLVAAAVASATVVAVALASPLPRSCGQGLVLAGTAVPLLAFRLRPRGGEAGGGAGR